MYFIIPFVALMLVALFAEGAQSSVEAIEFSRVKKALTSEELKLITENFKKLKLALKACEIQRSESLLPSECYASIWLAQELKVDEEIVFRRSAIDRECLNTAKRTIEIKNSISERDNKVCSQAAAERIRENLYKSGHDF
jgi:hypothetical protein